MDGQEVNPREELEITITPEGDSFINFMPVSFSDFVIDHMLSDEERAGFDKRTEMYGPMARRIFCG